MKLGELGCCTTWNVRLFDAVPVRLHWLMRVDSEIAFPVVREEKSVRPANGAFICYKMAFIAWFHSIIKRPTNSKNKRK